jgi:hypothetical protein
MGTRQTPECVKLQHRGGARIYEITKDMTREEELAYWAERTEALRRRQAELRAQRQKQAS